MEILVALALIGASSLLFTYFSGAFRVTRSAQIDTQALNLARSYLDTYRASVAANAPRPPVPSFANYTFAIDDSKWVAGTNNALRIIKVVVRGPDGVERDFVTNVVAPR